MERFAKIVGSLKLATTFAESTILDVCDWINTLQRDTFCDFERCITLQNAKSN